MQKNGLPELLAPAGTMEKLQTAIHYGADAVYLGASEFSLRARAGNFDAHLLPKAIAYAHDRGVKVYATVNIFARNRDLVHLADHLRFLRLSGVDALIIADPGVILLAREHAPGIPIHLSTQANTTNIATVHFWQQQGIGRFNLARELSLEEIREIRSATNAELEIFVHGALCISYSGRCLLSTYFTGRDANHGDCAHPCRYSYRIEEEKRPGQFFPVEEDDRGTYIFNSRDLCLLRQLPRLVAAEANSCKIEGRMKSLGYVGQVVRVYRAALDWIGAQRAAGLDLATLELPDCFSEEMQKTGTRGFSENFFQSTPSTGDMIYDTMRLSQPYAPAGIVRQTDPLIIETRNALEIGDTISWLGQGLDTVTVQVCAMQDQQGAPVQRANPNSLITLETDPALNRPKPLSLFRKKMVTP